MNIGSKEYYEMLNEAEVEDLYIKETGKECYTYLNDCKEFVVDEDYFYWLEYKVLRANKLSEEK